MMHIGNYQAQLIDAGRFRLDGGAMFGVVPRVLWEKRKPPDSQNRIQMGNNLLLLRGEGRVILVDTGIGDKIDQKFATIYAVDYSEHHLPGSLQKLGLKPEDVTDVILTHLHFDHAGGATLRDSNGNLRPAFPNAAYYLQKRQWEQGLHPSEKDRASYFPENYLPLQQHGQLVILEGEKELFPGVEVLPINGHTPGQQMVRVRGENQTLLYPGDLLPTSAHVPIPWVMAYDLYPMTTIEEKKHYLRRAADEGWLIVFEHDPEIRCATVQWNGKDYELKQECKTLVLQS